MTHLETAHAVVHCPRCGSAANRPLGAFAVCGRCGREWKPALAEAHGSSRDGDGSRAA